MRGPGWLVAVASGVLTAAGLASCGGPDADPEQALRTLCGDEAVITEAEVDSDPGDLVAGPELSCNLGDHGVRAVRYKRDGLETVEGEAAEFESGNGNSLGYAFAETDDGAGTAVYLYPPDDPEEDVVDADASLLDPLADEGWQIGPK